MSDSGVVVGDHVAWRWASGIAEGIVKRIDFGRIEIESKGKRIVRNGSPANPALVISHVSGNDVLKLVSEVQKVS